MKRTKAPASPPAPPPAEPFVNPIDSIGEQSGQIIGLSLMLRAIGELMTDGGGNDRHASDLFSGIAVVADVILNKVQDINEKADALCDAVYPPDGAR